MVKGMRDVYSFGEVAPAILISHRKSSSNPRLETIFEEVSYHTYSNDDNLEVVDVPKRVVVVLPVVLALSLYFLLYKDVAASA
ncbi:hypothetical protein MANES_15G124200v8 [Manihot esculenta]|uniref:Uncharacterized protein n=1 Tax=Manihot esculenta TaxID=3983 RepID=A0A2C9UGC3_MANES|nr:hypothetical protein MANES_15G124200v8 [Manihot esculenta]